MTHSVDCRAAFRAAALALSMAAAACASAGEKEQLGRIEQRLDLVYNTSRAQADVAANLEELTRAATTLAGKVEELNARQQMLSDRLDRIERGLAQRAEGGEELRAANIRLEAVNQRLLTLSAETLAFIELMEKKSGIAADRHQQAVARAAERVDAPPPAAAPAPSAAPQMEGAAPFDPGALYQRAYEQYLRGAYDDAVAGFTEYLKAQPETELSDNAAYWIAEARLAKQEPEAALAAFDEAAAKYPDGNKAPAALLRAAETLERLGNPAGARERLKMVIERYPTSGEALAAAKKLESPAR